MSAAERVKLLKRSGSGSGNGGAAPSLAPSRPAGAPRVRKPDLRRVKASPPVAPAHESYVGRRVREPVTSTRFREGRVVARDAASGTYSVRYDDPALPLRTGLSKAEVVAIALPRGAPKQSRTVELPTHAKASPTKRRDAKPSPPKAKAKAPAKSPKSATKRRRSGDGDDKEEEAAPKAAKAGNPSSPASVEAFLRSIQPPLSQARPSCDKSCVALLWVSVFVR